MLEPSRQSAFHTASRRSPSHEEDEVQCANQRREESRRDLLREEAIAVEPVGSARQDRVQGR